MKPKQWKIWDIDEPISRKKVLRRDCFRNSLWGVIFPMSFRRQLLESSSETIS